MVDLKSKLTSQNTSGKKSGESASSSKESTNIDPTLVGKTIFHSSKPTLRVRYKGDKQAAFKNHFLITDDKEIIDYLEKNFCQVERTSLTGVVQKVDEAFYISATSLPMVNVIIEPLPNQEQESTGTSTEDIKKREE